MTSTLFTILIAGAASLATFTGGYLALRFKDKLHLILGFSAGAVVGVAFFDLIPEAFELSAAYFSVSATAGFIALGFLAYLLLDRFIAIAVAHNHTDDHDHGGHVHFAPERGAAGALALSIHSVLDGLAVGLAFQASIEVGIVVTLAVLAHDFSDGINTVSLVLKSGGSFKRALRWLMLDAAAPIVGVCIALLFTFPDSALGALLAFFAGSFLYIGASDLIPESHHAHPKLLTTCMTLVGCGTMYAIITLAGV